MQTTNSITEDHLGGEPVQTEDLWYYDIEELDAIIDIISQPKFEEE